MENGALQITADRSLVKGSIRLSGSKSISNRALLLRALSGLSIDLIGLSDSDDTTTLQRLLHQEATTYDAGHAGTTYRFMTAYLALQPGTQILTGSQRMLQRPIGPLVDALNAIGAQIEYKGQEGYPPLAIGPFNEAAYRDHLTIPADISSQFISALMMIAPKLPRGLRISLTGDIVSRPYLDMTLRVMKDFGAVYRWIDEQTIDIPAQVYTAKAYTIEADWSAASYFYSMVALAQQAEIDLLGLTDMQLQGDHQMSAIAYKAGVDTTYIEGGIRITKNTDRQAKAIIEYDFVTCPDIAQTVMVMCSGLGTSGLYSGLQTLHIKETDRIKAMQQELQKVGTFLSKLPPKFSKKKGTTYYMLEGQAQVNTPTFDTYHDHRMAMALAPLALLGTITIRDAQVVTKSYPLFWEDLATLGFQIKEH